MTVDSPMITSITVIIVDKGVPSPRNKHEFAIFVSTNSSIHPSSCVVKL